MCRRAHNIDIHPHPPWDPGEQYPCLSGSLLANANTHQYIMSWKYGENIIFSADVMMWAAKFRHTYSYYWKYYGRAILPRMIHKVWCSWYYRQRFNQCMQWQLFHWKTRQGIYDLWYLHLLLQIQKYTKTRSGPDLEIRAFRNSKNRTLD